MAKESKLFIVLSCLVVVGLAAILIITPVQRGMFFRQDYLPFFVKASWFFIGIAVIMVIERRGIWKPVPDLALLAVVVLYGLTVFWAKSKGAAIDGALKYCIYLGVFLSARYASKQRVGNRLLRWSIVASGVVAAMVGLLAAAGIITYKDAVVGGRIYGSFQYPNALAAYEMFVSFMLFHAWFETQNLERPWARMISQVLFSLSGFAILLVIVLSYSRATWIIFAAAVVGYFAMLPAGARGGIFLRFMTALVPVLVVNVPMAAAIPATEHGLVKKYILIGAAICLAAEVARIGLTSLAKSRVSKVTAGMGKENESGEASIGTHSRTGGPQGRSPFLFRIPAALAIIAVAALVLGFATEAGQEVLAKVLPEAVIRRFKSITLTDRSLVTRFFATKDAFLIAKDNPFGTGAGGWNALYHRYQTTLYWFTETHNHFAQVLVETGFPGLAAYTLFWAFIFYMAFKAWKLAMAGKKTMVGDLHIYTVLLSELVATSFAVLSLVVHSSADFDLSIPSIAMALFAATGSLAGSSDAVFAMEGLSDLPQAGCKGSPWAIPDNKGKKKAQHSREKAGQEKSKRRPAWKSFNTAAGPLESRYLLDALSLVILAVIVMVPAQKYYRGMIYGSTGIQEIVKGNIFDGRDLMLKAMEYDPNTSSYALDLARSYIHEYKDTGDPDVVETARLYLDLAKEKNPYDLDTRSLQSQMLSALGLHDEGADAAYEVTEMIPLDIRFYELLATSANEAVVSHGLSLLSQSMQSEERQQHVDAMNKYAGIIKEIPARLEEQKAEITGLYEKTWNPGQLNVTRPIALSLGQVYFLEGNMEAAIENLSSAGKDPELQEDAGIWLRALTIATGTEAALPEGFEANEHAAGVISKMYNLLNQ
jgi:O-antigen ligase